MRRRCRRCPPTEYPALNVCSHKLIAPFQSRKMCVSETMVGSLPHAIKVFGGVGAFSKKPPQKTSQKSPQKIPTKNPHKKSPQKTASPYSNAKIINPQMRRRCQRCPPTGYPALNVCSHKLIAPLQSRKMCVAETMVGPLSHAIKVLGGVGAFFKKPPQKNPHKTPRPLIPIQTPRYRADNTAPFRRSAFRDCRVR